jgi:hypothetical protein
MWTRQADAGRKTDIQKIGKAEIKKSRKKDGRTDIRNLTFI